MTGTDAGSLVDFIEGTSPPPLMAPRSLWGKNIVTGKRQRKQTNFYDKQVFSAEYRKMALCDVPQGNECLGGSSRRERRK